MAVRIMLVFCGALLCLDSVTWADDKSSDQKKMQGSWDVVELVDDGKSMPKEVAAKWKVKIAGDKMTIIEPEGNHEVVIKLDPASKPKRIDATPADGPLKGKTLGGIYELQDDTLKLCLPSKETDKRPSEFVSKQGSDMGLMILKRAGK